MSTCYKCGEQWTNENRVETPLLCPKCELAGSAICSAWTRDLPTESGAYWWWNEDEDSAPIHIEIMYSGTDGSYFAPSGQYGWTRFQPVAEMGGWWMRLHEPPTPNDGTERQETRRQ